jgi:hypothetical protein
MADLLTAANGMQMPPEVLKVFESMQRVVHSPRPRPVLSKSFCRLRERQPGVFRKVRDWVASDHFEEKCRSAGAYSSWSSALKAFDAIDAGKKPHVAWGMNRPGRPRKQGLSKSEVAGARAESLRRTTGLRKSRACAEAIETSPDLENLEESNVARSRKKFEVADLETLRACGVFAPTE